jgi:Rps23 Pro-64 3,4-dihydroxylase Tpa1-like proline 4-hydroxylase
MTNIFRLNPGIDFAAIADTLAARRFAQVADFLMPEAADTLHQVLRSQTPYGLAAAGDGQPHGLYIRAEAMREMPAAQKAQLGDGAASAAAAGRFSFLYGRYPMVEAYKENWHPGHPLYAVLEAINSPPVLEFARAVSGMADILRADAQATLYARGHFLTDHDDLVESEGRRLAYVLNLTREWKPDWGGYLNILDDRGDVRAGFMPRFNTMNLFLVPLRHHVSAVAQFAPVGRYAITGWFRDR